MQMPGANPQIVHVIGVSIYYLQYSTNFWIYAARSTQYRKAYMHYFKSWKDSLCLDENIESEYSSSESVLRKVFVVVYKK